MDAGKDYGYDQTPRPSNNKIDPEEFAKAAAKAHENYKQTLKATSYASNSQYNSNYFANNPYLNSYFVQSNKQKQNYDDVSNQNNNQNSPYDLITASPYYYTSTRENLYDIKQKLPFDHDKALKNIVPIDVSNVVPQQNGLVRVNSISDSLNKLNVYNIGKDHGEAIQQSTPANDAIYYKDKNSFYSLNLKPKPEHYEFDRLKQPDSVSAYYGKEQGFDSLYNNGLYSSNKRFLDQRNANQNQVTYNNQDNAISSANNIQQSLHRPNQQSDGSGLIKFNDIPHRLTEGYTAEALRMNHNNNFDQNNLPNPLPLRLNQNVDNHHLDVATEILSKLMSNKGSNLNRPDFDQQAALATINGLKIANPYNVDLNLIADMLKGKSSVDTSQLFNLRDNYDKQSIPLKFDMSQLQQMNTFKNDNPLSLSSALSVLANPYNDIYNGGRFPYQGVKYSRSEEEAENIPIADASNNLPIGAVIDEEETVHIPEESNINEHQDDNNPTNIESEKPRVILDTESRVSNSRDIKHFSSPYSKRQPNARKYPKNEVNEPYPLLKPPPPHRQSHFGDKNRRRLHKHKILRVFKTEPLFEAGALNVEEFNSRSDTFPERDMEIEEYLT